MNSASGEMTKLELCGLKEAGTDFFVLISDTIGVKISFADTLESVRRSSFASATLPSVSSVRRECAKAR